MKYFDKQTVVQVNNLSKKDVKEYIKRGFTDLDVKMTYRCHLISNKSKVITTMDNKILFFTYYNKIVPMFEFYNTSIAKVVLDSGAIKPISRGADVMAPGVIKYKDQQSNFKNGDIVFIEILDDSSGFLGIGIATMDFKECLQSQSGIVIEVLHVRNGYLENLVK